MANQDTRSPFKWQPLFDGEIRLLHVLSYEPEIRISLSHASSSEPARYHCISYSWQGQNASEAITCDGAVMYVTSSIAEALRNIPRTTGHRALWIDAICIDQANIHEKAEQVKLIHLIFTNAIGVLVWLGPATVESDRAMNIVADLVKNVPPSKSYEWLPDMSREDHEAFFQLGYNKMQCLAQLSAQSALKRLWIAQEMIVAKTLFFICGSKMIEGMAFLRVVSTLDSKLFLEDAPTTMEGFVAYNSRDQFSAFQAVANTMNRRQHMLSMGAHGFLALLDELRGKEVTEPVDRIYAVLHLAQDHESFYRHRVEIDYSATNKARYWKLYAEVACVTLYYFGLSDLFSMASSCSRPVELPSWCPNFNSTRMTCRLSRKHSANQRFELLSPTTSGAGSHTRQYNQRGRRTRPHVIAQPPLYIVLVHGAVVDAIQTVIPATAWAGSFDLSSFERFDTFGNDLDKWLSLTFEAYLRCMGYETDNVFDGYMRVLFEGIPFCKQLYDSALHSPMECLHALRDLFDTASPHFFSQNEEPFSSTSLVQTSNLDERDWFQKLETLMPLIHELEDIWKNRSFVVTSDGRAGFASVDVEPGDSICMFYGGNTMYVLRSMNKSFSYHGDEFPLFRFVSDAYIQGLMSGETFDLLDTGKVTELVFALR